MTVRFLVGALAAVAGAALAVTVLLLLGWRHVPVQRHEVRVFFGAEATAAQRAQARELLDGIPGADGPARFRTRAEAWADVQKVYADSGDPVPEGITSETVRETLIVSTRGREFACAPLEPVKTSPGVEMIRVAVFEDETGLIEALDC